MEQITELMDADAVRRAIRRMAHQILENAGGTDELALIGVWRRGVSVAMGIAENIRDIGGVNVPVGTLDITLYRDDMEGGRKKPSNGTAISFDVTGRKVVLADDVLYTGRTARAAMDAIMDLGRPAWIKYAVLVDRGHRELPIKADFVGKNVPTAERERIFVKMPEFDGGQGVYLAQKGKSSL